MTREHGIAVLGLGGIGGMVAVRTGALCVGTERTVAAIRADGLTLATGAESIVVHPEAEARLERPVSLLVVAVKSYSLEAALDRVAPGVLDDAVILPLLNGLEHVDAIRARLAMSHTSTTPVAVAAASIGRVEAYSPEPGLVVQRTPGDAVVAAASRDLEHEALEAVLAPLRVSGIEVVVAGDERAVLWDKAARLAVLAAATVASGESVGALRADAAWRPRLEFALAEGCAVAAADGVRLDPAGQWAIIEGLRHDLTTSAARDAAAGRPTELDAITGSVLRAGRRLGIAAPALEGLLDEARARLDAAA